MRSKTLACWKVCMLVTLGLIQQSRCRKVKNPLIHQGKNRLYWDSNELEDWIQIVLEHEKGGQTIARNAEDIDKVENLEHLAYMLDYPYQDSLDASTFPSNLNQVTNQRNFIRNKRSDDAKFCDPSKPANDINGGWSPWSRVGTPCSKKCGGGKMSRKRSCTNPVPQVLKFKSIPFSLPA